MWRPDLAQVLGLAATFALVSSPGLPAMSDPATATCNGVAATIVGTDGNDVLTGTAGNDVIAGLGGDDTIHGGGGDDLICGGDAQDLVFGDAGNDRLFGEAGMDRLHGGDGNDELSGGTVGYPLAPWFADKLAGEAGDDVLHRNQDGLQVFNFAQAPQGVQVDLMAGTATGWGNDTLDPAVPGASGDVPWSQAVAGIIGSVHADTLLGSDAPDLIRGRGGDDVIDGRGGADHITARPAGVTVRGGPGDDYVLVRFSPNTPGTRTGEASARYFGGAGDDTLELGTHPRTVRTGPGADRVTVATQLATRGAVLDVGGGTNVVFLRAKPVHWTPHVTVDLRAGWITGGPERLRLGGSFHELHVTGYKAGRFGRNIGRLTMLGTSRSEVLSASARTVTIRAGAGDDVLTSWTGDDVLDGQAGDDSTGPFGGAGAGHDVCISLEEKHTGCEVLRP